MMASPCTVIGGKVEQAYRRGDLFNKRRRLMDAWAVYCAAPKAGKVVAFRRQVTGLPSPPAVGVGVLRDVSVRLLCDG
jgi:hypothetical protein